LRAPLAPTLSARCLISGICVLDSVLRAHYAREKGEDAVLARATAIVAQQKEKQRQRNTLLAAVNPALPLAQENVATWGRQLVTHAPTAEAMGANYTTIVKGYPFKMKVAKGVDEADIVKWFELIDQDQAVIARVAEGELNAPTPESYLFPAAMVEKFPSLGQAAGGAGSWSHRTWSHIATLSIMTRSAAHRHPCALRARVLVAVRYRCFPQRQ
jgi:hypothetical protein